MEEMIMMHMWFYQSSEAVFLFKQFETNSIGPYIVGLIITFLLSAMLEALSLIMLVLKISIKKENFNRSVSL